MSPRLFNYNGQPVIIYTDMEIDLPGYTELKTVQDILDFCVNINNNFPDVWIDMLTGINYSNAKYVVLDFIEEALRK